MYILNQIVPTSLFFKNDKDPFTKYLTPNIQANPEANYFTIYFLICLYPQSKSSHYTAHTSCCYRAHDLFPVDKF